MTVYIHISKDRNSLKHCLIDQIFFLQIQDIPIKFIFLFLCSIQMSIFLELLKKNGFLIIYIQISKGNNSLKNCSRLTWFSSTGSGDSNKFFFWNRPNSKKYWHLNTTQRTKLIRSKFSMCVVCTKFGQNWLRINGIIYK